MLWLWHGYDLVWFSPWQDDEIFVLLLTTNHSAGRIHRGRIINLLDNNVWESAVILFYFSILCSLSSRTLQ